MRWCKNSFLPREHIFTFLDDVHALSALERTSAICKLLEDILFAKAGTPEHGTEQVRSQRAWKSWATKCGTPQGSIFWELPLVRKNSTRERLAEEAVLWRAIMGGLGSRSAARIAPAAYWASWGDAVHMIHRRFPQIAHSIIGRLQCLPSLLLPIRPTCVVVFRTNQA